MPDTKNQWDRLEPLPREFYERGAGQVARDLLGRLMIRSLGHQSLVGRIVETEAYLARGDDACHAARGLTRRNASMFGPGGHAYVYAIHAKWCCNAVTGIAGVGCAVLIRAIEPCAGVAAMRRRRGVERLHDLTRGPARLCQALGIDRRQDGVDLTRRGELWIADGGDPALPPDAVGVSERIGVTTALALPLRYYIRGNRFVSGPKRMRE